MEQYYKTISSMMWQRVVLQIDTNISEEPSPSILIATMHSLLILFQGHPLTLRAEHVKRLGNAFGQHIMHSYSYTMCQFSCSAEVTVNAYISRVTNWLQGRWSMKGV